MPLAWIASVIFYAAYAIGYFLNVTLPHNGWTLATALAAAVIAILLIVDNRTVITNRRAD